MDEIKVAENSIALLSIVMNAVFPLLGVVVGAGLHYFSSRSAEAKRHERMLRVEAYSDYLRSVGEMEGVKKTLDPALQYNAFARAIAAKARVCVHGSAFVVDALSKFEGSPGQGLTDERKKLFLEFMAAVRKDTGAKGAQLKQVVIEKVLFGKKETPKNANIDSK